MSVPTTIDSIIKEGENSQIQFQDQLAEWEDLGGGSILKKPIPEKTRNRYYSNNECRKVSFDENLNTVHTYCKDNKKEMKNFESCLIPKKKHVEQHKKTHPHQKRKYSHEEN